MNGERHGLARTPILFWESTLTGKIEPDPRNFFGFVYSAGDIPTSESGSGSDAAQNQSNGSAQRQVDGTNLKSAWDLSPHAVARWRVVVFHQWSKSYHTVKAIFPSNRTILFDQPAPYWFGQFVNNTASARRWYIINPNDISPAPGYFRIVGNATVEYNAAAGIQGSGARVFPPPPTNAVLPTLTNLLSVHNAANVSISGLSFAYTDAPCPSSSAADSDTCSVAAKSAKDHLGQLVNIVQSPATTLRNCSFIGAAANAVWISQSPGATITHSMIANSGANAVRVENSRGAVVSQSKMLGAGQVVQNAAGVAVVNSRNASIVHNEVAKVVHDRGILWTNFDDLGAYTEVAYNHIHHCGCQTDECLSDGGGLYGSATTPSVLPVYLHHNVVHDITARNFGGAGIYLDTSTNAAQVTHNAVWNVADQCFYWHLETFGRIPLAANAEPTRVQNNIFVKSAYNAVPHTGQAGFARGGKVIDWEGYSANSTFSTNVVAIMPPALSASEHGAALQEDTGNRQLHRNRQMMASGPAVAGLVVKGVSCAGHFHVSPPNSTCTAAVVDSYSQLVWNRNVYWNASDQSAWILDNSSTTFGDVSYKSWRAQHGHDRDSIVASPMFLDAGASDYRLAAASPAIKTLGFDYWDWTAPGAVGPDWGGPQVF